MYVLGHVFNHSSRCSKCPLFFNIKSCRVLVAIQIDEVGRIVSEMNRIWANVPLLGYLLLRQKRQNYINLEIHTKIHTKTSAFFSEETYTYKFDLGSNYYIRF